MDNQNRTLLMLFGFEKPLTHTSYHVANNYIAIPDL